MSADARIEIRVSHEEKAILKNNANIRSMTLSDYARKKLFEDNFDVFNEKKMKCISPSGPLHENIVALSCKTIEATLLYLIQSINKDLSPKTSKDIIKHCRDEARQGLSHLGYFVIKSQGKK